MQGGGEADESQTILVDERLAGARLDRALTEGLNNRMPDAALSRARVKSLIEQGLALLNGATIAEPSYRVKPGDELTLHLPPPENARPLPQDIPLVIVYEDEDLIVIDKPAGLVVHPAPGNPNATLVNALIAHCGASLSGINGVKRPGIVHRLDKDTSGLLVAAKTDLAHQGLAAQFADHSIERAYRALVWGQPPHMTGRIEGAIGRDPRNRKKMALRRQGGKAAITHYKRLHSYAGGSFSLLECRLETGRTHQIRVHLTSQGLPLVGDPIYGQSRLGSLRALPTELRTSIEKFPRQALHAGLLGFIHPRRAEALRFQSPIPEDIQNLITSLETVS